MPAQYNFSGQLSPEKEGETVYLSLVENYRKSSRIYTDQIIQKTLVTQEGFFTFKGSHLLSGNRIYRIHTDECHINEKLANHFLRECYYSQSILFIANNKDTLELPLLQNNQALCNVISTNDKSSYLLEIDALKEEMILDFSISDSKAKQEVNFRKWFRILQQYGRSTNEPLVELYIYDFLSDRTNETHSFYQKDLVASSYYSELLERLTNVYPNTPFTAQYQEELLADAVIANRQETSSYPWHYFLYGGIAVFLAQFCYGIFKKRTRNILKKAKKELTPQEFRVFEAINNGKSNKEIASQFFISLSTVKTHINNIYKKLEITSRDEFKKQ
ncbi:response regulator transcription factor [Maribacter sp. CXY002]|uniref:response regulator transcription factor n=1 Tax=Maribacter luteocoastalis TaxID=3407671 RepID=UPI003B68358D